MLLSRIGRSISRSSRSPTTLFNSTTRASAIANHSGSMDHPSQGFFNTYFSSIAAARHSAPSFPRPNLANPIFSRFFSTDLPNKTNYEIKLGKGDDQKNILRPLSPHLPIYKPQSHSLQSILNRVSGIYLTGLFLAFHLAYVKAGAICLTYPSFYEALFYSSKLSLLSLEIAALATVYHLYHGIRHV